MRFGCDTFGPWARRSDTSRTVLMAVAALLVAGEAVRAGEEAVVSPARGGIGICEDEKLCTEPCPAKGACYLDSHCGEGLVCAPPDEPPDFFCIPSYCTCDPIHDDWGCTDDCQGKCVAYVPASSQWGMCVLALSLLVGLTICARRRSELGLLQHQRNPRFV